MGNQPPQAQQSHPYSDHHHGQGRSGQQQQIPGNGTGANMAAVAQHAPPYMKGSGGYGQQQQYPGNPGYGGAPYQPQQQGNYTGQQQQQQQQQGGYKPRKVGSDVSMSDVGGSPPGNTSGGGQAYMQQQQPLGPGGQPYHRGQQPQPTTSGTPMNNQMQFPGNDIHAAMACMEDDDTVPTVFRWEHGGRQVYITGTFNDWSRQIPMHRSGNDFTYIHNLKKGKHAFKFIVDDEWRFAPDQPTVADIEGRINNFIDVSDFKPYTGDRNFEERYDGNSAATSLVTGGSAGANSATGSAVGIDAGAQSAEGGGGADGKGSTTATTASGASSSATADHEKFSHTMPDLDEYTKEPPPLPPHLRHIILNKAPQLSDTAALPVPQHVALNHLYCTAIKDNMMVLGITQRYKTKFVTTVYYSPCAS